MERYSRAGGRNRDGRPQRDIGGAIIEYEGADRGAIIGDRPATLQRLGIMGVKARSNKRKERANRGKQEAGLEGTEVLQEGQRRADAKKRRGCRREEEGSSG